MQCFSSYFSPAMHVSSKAKLSHCRGVRRIYTKTKESADVLAHRKRFIFMYAWLIANTQISDGIILSL